jgi:diguanylate cyclase (GGDEF)-like protein
VVLRLRNDRWEIAATTLAEQEISQRELPALLAAMPRPADGRGLELELTPAVLEHWIVRHLDAGLPRRWALAVGRRPNAALVETWLYRMGGELALALEVCTLKAALARSDLVIRRTSETVQQLPADSDAAELCRRILEAAAEVGRATMAVLALGSADDEALRIVATVGYPLVLVQDLPVRTDAGILGFVYRSGEAILARSDLDFPELPRRRLRYRTQSFIAVPLQADQRTLGVVALADRRDANPFDESDFASVRSLAGAAARMLRSLQLLDERRYLLDQTALDHLTGLLNRRTLEKRLQEELERARRQQLPLAVLMIDVDSFKAVNDSLGHLKGDEILRRVAQILRSSIRVFDVSARYGGDEFAVVMPAISASAVVQTAERIRRRIERVRLAGASETPVSVSIGVVILSLERSSDELLERADQALYRAKGEGRNRVAMAEPSRS